MTQKITNPIITKDRILKLNEVLSHGLVCGLGEQIPGRMCVEAAVCFVFDLPHGDNPPCVGSAVRAFKIALNDSKWSDNHARALGMKKLAIAQLGSDALDQMEFGKTVFLRSTQKLLPIAFRKVATDPDVKPEHAAEFLKHADLCEKVTSFEEARIAGKEAYAYASASASAYASDSASAYAYASDSASASDYASASASASDYAWFIKNLGDDFLRLTGEIGLQVLIDMRCEGCKWLSLADESPTKK